MAFLPTFSSIAQESQRFGLVFICALFSLWSRAQTDVSGVLMLGRTALAYDDYITAITYFNQANQARPYLAEPYYWRAVAKFSLDDHSGATNDLDQALTHNPYQTHYYSLRALCHIQLQNYHAAIADYDHALIDQPEEQQFLFNRTLCLLQLSDTSATQIATTQLLQRYPQWPRAHHLRLQHHLLTTDTLSALQQADQLLLISPTDADAWAFKGRRALQLGQNDVADSCLSLAIRHQRHPQHELHLARAQARHALGQYGQALADYDATIQLIPQHFVAHYNRGLLRSFVGDDNRAIEDFDFVLAQDPTNILATYNRALLRERTGNYRGAIADYSHILKTYPHFLYGYAARARCHRLLGHSRAALADETRVARQRFDALYRPQSSKTLKKVRHRSDKRLEHYQQLVEVETSPTTLSFAPHAGRVQHRPVQRISLPLYRFVVLSPTDQQARRLYTPITSQLSAHQAQLSSAEGALLALSVLQQLFPQPTPEEQALIYLQSAAHWVDSIPEQALSALDSALVLAPQWAYLHYNRGYILAQLARLPEAIESYNRALQIDNLLAEAFYNRAVALLLQGKNTEAQADLSRAGQLGLYKAYNLLKQAKQIAIP